MMREYQKQDTVLPPRLPPVSVFGHADPTGDDDYNKQLSGRRALAVYGLLIRETAIWDELFLKPFGGDKWGLRSMRFMLSVIQDPSGSPFFTGAPDSTEPGIDTQTKKSIKAYEKARGLTGGGLSAMPSKATRKAMFLEYMDILCHEEDGTGFKLDPGENFIAKQKDKKTFRGDVQGCSEFNPIFLLSKAEEDLFASKTEFKAARDELYAKDRRVLIYVFRHDTEIKPDKWPCPEARGGASNCRKRFWSDSAARLRREDDQREFKDKQDTMACRFYHGFAHNSPCETGGRLWIIRFQIDAPNQKMPVPLKNRRYVLTAGQVADAAVIRGTLDANGEVRIPVFDERSTITIKLDAFGPLPKPKVEADAAGDDSEAPPPSAAAAGEFPGESTFLAITLDAGALEAAQNDLGAKQRLYNLGFGSKTPEQWSQAEQERAVRAYNRSRAFGDSTDLESVKDPVANEHERTDVPVDDPDTPTPVASGTPT